MEARKEEEVQFHNRLKSPLTRTRELVRLTANKKYYSVAMSSIRYYERWLLERCSGKRVLDYGCGDGKYARLLAVHGANVVGFDISDASVRKARALARVEGVEDRTWFCVADGEALNFKNDTFDIVCESGVLHHVDLAGAIVEVARVLKPEGQMICYEALGHNPLFQAYRRLTPHLRTAYEAEHILKVRDLKRMRRWFGQAQARFFHLAVLVAVPFRTLPGFRFVLRALDLLDSVLLCAPFVRRQAWMVIFVLSRPRKE